ncbi:MAG: aminotransferase class IV [Bacteroidales bacterium]|nr:aminotransferase class IV [Bacteroidales bacterium]
MFLLKGNTLVTPPANTVLPGITRHKVIKLCREFNIPLSFRKLPYQQLAGFNEAFITGTSPKIFLIRRIDDFEFELSFRIVKKLMQAYERLIREEIRSRTF